VNSKQNVSTVPQNQQGASSGSTPTSVQYSTSTSLPSQPQQTIETTPNELKYDDALENEIWNAFENTPDLYDPNIPNEYEPPFEPEDENLESWTASKSSYNKYDHRRRYKSNYKKEKRDSTYASARIIDEEEHEQHRYGKRKRSPSFDRAEWRKEQAQYGYESTNDTQFNDQTERLMQPIDSSSQPNRGPPQIDKQAFLKVSTGEEIYARRLAMSTAL